MVGTICPQDIVDKLGILWINTAGIPLYRSKYKNMRHDSGHISGVVTSVTFKGVNNEIITDIDGFKWMIQTTEHKNVGETIGLDLNPDDIHIMRKSEYSSDIGDYSSFSDEFFYEKEKSDL